MQDKKVNNNILYNFPTDIFCHILQFSTIADYAFNILQISKTIHNEYNPYKKPFIIKHLIENEGKLEYFGVPFFNKNEWHQLVKQENWGINKYLNIKNKLTPIQSWQIAGHYAWKNQNKSLIPQQENDKYLKMLKDENGLKELSLKSGLFLLNFFYLVRYGGIDKVKKLKQLYAQCISTGKGALGIRIMFHFYWKQLFINIINKRSNDFIIDIKTGKIIDKPKDFIKTGDANLEEVLKRMYDIKYDQKIFEFTKEMFEDETSKYLKYFDFDDSLSGLNESGVDIYWFHQIGTDIRNYITNVMRELIYEANNCFQGRRFQDCMWWLSPWCDFNRCLASICKFRQQTIV